MGVTIVALAQLFEASSCKRTSVGRFHHLICSYVKVALYSQHTPSYQGKQKKQEFLVMDALIRDFKAKQAYAL